MCVCAKIEHADTMCIVAKVQTMGFRKVSLKHVTLAGETGEFPDHRLLKIAWNLI